MLMDALFTILSDLENYISYSLKIFNVTCAQVTVAWHVLRSLIEDTASRYGRWL
jgi:hypothetical protein